MNQPVLRLCVVVGVLLSLSACQTGEPLTAKSVAAVTSAENLAVLEQAAQARVKPFASQLLSAVQGAMQAGGPTQAVTVCTEIAPALAKQASTEGWVVGRTSDKVRNSQNTADEWESMVLAQFAGQVAAGQPVASLKQSAVVAGEYRYMQAIGVGQPCLACHGQSIAPDVTASIKNAYPNDQAVGYQLGQLRGAFTLRKPL